MSFQPILIKNARIITHETLSSETHLFISNGIIQEINRDLSNIEKKYDVSKAITINAKNKFLTPGLIDAHVHLILNGDLDIVSYVNTTSKKKLYQNAKDNLMKSINNGITTVRDVGDTAGILNQIKKESCRQLFPMPHLVTSGEMITTSKGHVKTICHQINDSKTEIQHAIEKQNLVNADFIKLIISGGMLTKDSTPLQTELDKNLVLRLCQEAKMKNIPVAAHAYSSKDISAALEGRVASIEQGVFASEANLKKAAQQNVVFVPTLKVSYDIIDHKDILPQYMVKNAELVLSKAKSFIRNVQRYNVNLAMGTDAGTPFNFHGDNAKELELLVENGYPIKKAIQSATNIPAKLLGMNHRLGKIDVGIIADILLLSKNPIDDISAFQKNITCVISKGVCV